MRQLHGSRCYAVEQPRRDRLQAAQHGWAARGSRPLLFQAGLDQLAEAVGHEEQRADVSKPQEGLAAQKRGAGTHRRHRPCQHAVLWELRRRAALLQGVERSSGALRDVTEACQSAADDGFKRLPPRLRRHVLGQALRQRRCAAAVCRERPAKQRDPWWVEPEVDMQEQLERQGAGGGQSGQEKAAGQPELRQQLAASLAVSEAARQRMQPLRHEHGGVFEAWGAGPPVRARDSTQLLS